MPYKAVGFDYGGVMGGVDGGDFTKEVSTVLDIDENDYRELYFSINHLINTGEVDSWREFWELFLDKLGKPDKINHLMAVSDRRADELAKVNKDMLDLVDQLRKDGYKVGLLSNNTKENGRKLRETGVDNHFDVFMISADVGLMKPHREIFMKFIDQLGVKPTEMVFIDDSEKSLSTAEECGFTPILFENYENLRKNLVDLGIL